MNEAARPWLRATTRVANIYKIDHQGERSLYLKQRSRALKFSCCLLSNSLGEIGVEH